MKKRVGVMAASWSAWMGMGMVLGALLIGLMLAFDRYGGTVAAYVESGADAVVGDADGLGDSAYGANGQRGIWVMGSAFIPIEPDIATLNIGVYVRGDTVADANAKAAAAMEAALSAFVANNVDDKDVQTRRFSIYPRYERRELIEEGVRASAQVLTGYQVTNDVKVKIRDIDSVGFVIDDVVAMAGDSVRINGVTFGVDDPDALRPELRRMAVEDAIAKAEALARLSGVEVGRLIYLSEGGAWSVGGYGRTYSALAFEAESAAAPIRPGEQEVGFSVSAGFEIR